MSVFLLTQEQLNSAALDLAKTYITQKRGAHFNLSNLVSRSNLSRSQTTYTLFAGEGVNNMNIYTRTLV